jgi:3-hydroxyacyl-[acyl-carrier-protein] dehydratase
MLDINEIKSMLPHRYPFLLVDRVLEIEPKKHIVAMKNVTANENFFNGHFPARPVMPGVLIIECMAQAAGILMLAEKEYEGKIPYFTGIDNARFRRTIIPGDQIMLEVEILRVRGNVGRAKGVAKVDGKVAAEAEMMFIMSE